MRLALAALIAIGLATVVGMAALWPGDVSQSVGQGAAVDTEPGTVESVTLEPCPPPQTGECQSATVALEGGETVRLPAAATATAPRLEPGDGIEVAAFDGPDGTTYAFADFTRGGALLILALAFAALVVVFGRLRGALSLLGLVLSLAVIVFFMAPAMLDGREPVAVAVVGALAVMAVTITLAHGIGPKSVAAMLGTTFSLLLVLGLALTFTELAHLTGFSSEEATVLNLDVASVSFDGLLVAGMVIGALGVLDDVTVSQASTVLALRAANPRLSFRGLFGGAAAVGRDHVSATVNTLVLAYAGSSLPLLLLFTAGGGGFGEVVTSEVVAKEIVAMLVGSIGLIAAVPLTTAVAALLASRIEAGELGDAERAHAH